MTALPYQCLPRMRSVITSNIRPVEIDESAGIGVVSGGGPSIVKADRILDVHPIGVPVQLAGKVTVSYNKHHSFLS